MDTNVRCRVRLLLVGNIEGFQIKAVSRLIQLTRNAEFNVWIGNMICKCKLYSSILINLPQTNAEAVKFLSGSCQVVGVHSC